MATLAPSSKILPYFEAVQGQTAEDKFLSLIETYLTTQIRACEQEIGAYEVKYRSTFAEFASMWEQGRIPGRHSHEVERDYMEWEGLVAEKQSWLEKLRELPAPIAA